MSRGIYSRNEAPFCLIPWLYWFIRRPIRSWLYWPVAQKRVLCGRPKKTKEWCRRGRVSVKFIILLATLFWKKARASRSHTHNSFSLSCLLTDTHALTQSSVALYVLRAGSSIYTESNIRREELERKRRERKAAAKKPQKVSAPLSVHDKSWFTRFPIQTTYYSSFCYFCCVFRSTKIRNNFPRPD